MARLTPSRPRHQLTVSIQYKATSDEAFLSYSYPYSSPHELREQRLEVQPSTMNLELRTTMDSLVEAVAERITVPAPVRLPHAQISPDLWLGWFTLAVQDQASSRELPACRLYYYEEIRELDSRIEKDIKLERSDLSDIELSLAQRASTMLRKLAWDDYRRRFAEHFLGSQS